MKKSYNPGLQTRTNNPPVQQRTEVKVNNRNSVNNGVVKNSGVTKKETRGIERTGSDVNRKSIGRR